MAYARIVAALPNAREAVIEQRRLVEYVLDRDHPRNGGKADAFAQLGFALDTLPQRARGATDVERRLRAALPGANAKDLPDRGYGPRWEVRAPFSGPNGRTATAVSYWQMDYGSDAPRLITLWLEVHEMEVTDEGEAV